MAETREQWSVSNDIKEGNSFADDCSLFMIARKKCTGYLLN